MRVRHLLIATTIITIWTGGARLAAIRMGSVPLKEFGFDDWLMAYFAAFVAAFAIGAMLAIVVGITIVIDCVFFRRK